jgi:Na+/H+ antiporter NhaB
VEELQQEYILSLLFSRAIARESLLIEKYRSFMADNKKNAALKEILDEFEKEAREHLDLLKEKMIKLNIQG